MVSARRVRIDGIVIEYGAYREVGTELSVTTVVPVPAAVWLFGSALAGLAGIQRFRRPPARL